ncbi:aminopeptidase [Limnobaculum zhutongyuii]|uniref:Aminopeptidase n=1 Tax=Limnobaculum zhutongyuii TaxID=2498113 RepID=A0A411WHA0_9GAMM|nr:aminopeptidase [Limnobaculum zhutongyuii]QBH95589.1 aminopeptidase [Limnobaculum zhutongyuii]TQS88720.1 aminopeptidase [Limnobaculum zhutongyuii]
MKQWITQQCRLLMLVVLGSLIVSGCSVRSISNADNGRNQFYAGELSDQDVLGAMPKQGISDADIKTALNNSRYTFRLPKDSSILLIQSGAMTPDAEMQKALKEYYSVAVFSGIPPNSQRYRGYNAQPVTEETTDYPRLLRLTAANGGQDKIIVYWGQLESGSENEVTKVVSWVPFVGGVLPDETQHMRIVLRVALIDVLSGRWVTFTPEVFENSSVSGRYNRDSKDLKQIMELKAQAYDAAAKEIFERYGR